MDEETDQGEREGPREIEKRMEQVWRRAQEVIATFGQGKLEKEFEDFITRRQPEILERLSPSQRSELKAAVKKSVATFPDRVRAEIVPDKLHRAKGRTIPGYYQGRRFVEQGNARPSLEVTIGTLNLLRGICNLVLEKYGYSNPRDSFIGGVGDPPDLVPILQEYEALDEDFANAIQ